MDNTVQTESGVELLSRLFGRPDLAAIDKSLFIDGLDMGDMVQISGGPSVGKSLFLFKLIAKHILPKQYGDCLFNGFEAGVVLVDTDHNNSILMLIAMLEDSILKAENSSGREISPTLKEEVVKTSLKRLFILKTYSSDQLICNFYSLGKLLTANRSISLVIVDSISSFYWQDAVKMGAMSKMDLYLNSLVQKLKINVQDYNVVCFVVKQAYFQSKSHESGLGIFRYKVELKKGDSGNTYYAVVQTSTSVRNLSYMMSKCSFEWTNL